MLKVLRKQYDLIAQSTLVKSATSNLPSFRDGFFC